VGIALCLNEVEIQHRLSEPITSIFVYWLTCQQQTAI